MYTGIMGSTGTLTVHTVQYIINGDDANNIRISICTSSYPNVMTDKWGQFHHSVEQL